MPDHFGTVCAPSTPMHSPSSKTEQTACVILAAGASRRLGHAKQIAMVGGRTLLQNVVDAALATPSLWPVVVVLGAHAEEIKPTLVRHPVLIVENPAWEEGLASSLRAGLQTALTFSRQLDAVIFTLCDQPELRADVLTSLLARRSETGRSVVAASYGGHPGAPALLQRRHFGALAHLTGDEGARKLILSLPAEDVELVDHPALSLDVDTPEDLAKAQASSNG